MLAELPCCHIVLRKRECYCEYLVALGVQLVEPLLKEPNASWLQWVAQRVLIPTWAFKVCQLCPWEPEPLCEAVHECGAALTA